MFRSLSDRLGQVFDKLRGRGVLTEDDITKAMREIRIALLEADVALPVVKQFIAQVKERALGAEVYKSISPGQMIVKIVHDNLVQLLQSDDGEINLNAPAPASIMMVGLQGSGKTTTTAKLATYLKKSLNKKILLASLDIYRPAAREQLKKLGAQIQVDSLEIIVDEKPLEITDRALQYARVNGYDLVVFDTAGRLHIDENLMDELVAVKNKCQPVETLLVVDALTGQDAVNIAESFHKKLEITGSVLTRIDGDGRGGAALSMRHVTNRPIKFLGFGEKVDAFETFDAERIANRILDMGDVVGLVQKAAENIAADDNEKLMAKMTKGQFSLTDFRDQLLQMDKMGGVGTLMGMLPGFNKIKDQMAEKGLDEKVIKHQVAIINSMTKRERIYPKLLNASRKRRIAKGCGMDVQHINKLLKQFEQMQKVMKKMKNMGKGGLLRSGLGSLFGGGGKLPI